MLRKTLLTIWLFLSLTVFAKAGPVAGAIAAISAVVGGGSVLTAVVGAVLSIAVNFAANALFGKKPKAPNVGAGPLAEPSRTEMVRGSVESQKIIYGQVKTSGVIGYLNTTDSNHKLHNVLILAAHECQSIDEIYFNEDQVPGTWGSSDASVSVASGDYSGKARINTHLGSPTQTADADLITDDSNWSSNHRLRGLCYIYTRFNFDDSVYPNGMPTIRALVKGKKLYDPRTTSTAYSNNPALVLYDYLTNNEYGLGVDSGDIDTTSFNAAANICEETVPSLGPALNWKQPYNDTDADGGFDSFNADTQKGITVDSNGTQEGTPTEHYAGWQMQTSFEDTATYVVTYTLTINSGSGTVTPVLLSGASTSFAAATVSTAGTGRTSDNTYSEEITFSGTPTTYSYLAFKVTATDTINFSISDCRIAKKNSSEYRYTCNGVLDTASGFKDNIDSILSSCGGKLLYANGKYYLNVADYQTPTITLDESILSGPISVKTALPFSETYNTVKGVFMDPDRDWQAADYPTLISDTYLNQDGKANYIDYPLYMTTSASMAQRLAKIKLLQSRQSLRASLKCNLAAYKLKVGDTVMITNTQFGWSSKVFEIERLEFGYEATEIYVSLSVRETASSIYDWGTDEDTAIDLAPNTTLAIPEQATTVRVVDTLPTSDNYEGKTVYLTTDNKIYRYDGSNYIASTSASDLTAGTISAQEIIIAGGSSGKIRSTNYSAGSAGWQIDGAGDAEFNNVTVRGILDTTTTYTNNVYAHSSQPSRTALGLVSISSKIGVGAFNSHAGHYNMSTHTYYPYGSASGSSSTWLLKSSQQVLVDAFFSGGPSVGYYQWVVRRSTDGGSTWTDIDYTEAITGGGQYLLSFVDSFTNTGTSAVQYALAKYSPSEVTFDIYYCTFRTTGINS